MVSGYQARPGNAAMALNCCRVIARPSAGDAGLAAVKAADLMVLQCS